ncbi:MAG: hypothetical protein KKE16_07170 [Firmicutes bacterium]|nr:hypothetical protein [Bacillota bacterium]
MNKKLLVVILLSLFAFLSFTNYNVDASAFATQYGFTYDTEIYNNVGWVTNSTNFSKYNDRIIGATTTTAGYYLINQEYNENPLIDLYTVMARYTMTPMKTAVYSCGLFNWFTCQDYGYSDKLTVQSQLDYYVSGANNYLAYYSPTTMYNSTTYTVGGGISYTESDGLGIAVNASATFNVNDMYITNLSQSPLRYYGTLFDYNMRSFVVKDSFYTETFNYSMYIIENPHSASYFSNMLQVIGVFNVSSGWGRYDTYYTNHPCSNQTNIYFVDYK